MCLFAELHVNYLLYVHCTWYIATVATVLVAIAASSAIAVELDNIFVSHLTNLLSLTRCLYCITQFIMVNENAQTFKRSSASHISNTIM